MSSANIQIISRPALSSAHPAQDSGVWPDCALSETILVNIGSACAVTEGWLVRTAPI